MCLLPADGRIDERSLSLLSRALDLAEEAASFASPNPTVGCVLAIQENLLGEGAHHFDTRDHAEIVALKAAASVGHSVRGATAYVTLEPCSHHGRTGPCADALIAGGIARCLIGTVDPNPLVRGQGIGKLRAAGIDVLLLSPASSLAQRARRLNDAFAFSIQHGRPFVTLKAAVSQDGKIAPQPAARSGKFPFWLTGTAAREDVQRLRHTSDAILTGIGTVLADDPSLTDRTGLPRRKPLLRVVLDGDLRTPQDSQVVRSAQGDLLILCSAEAPLDRERELRSHGADVLRIATTNGKLDLPHVMASLAAQGVRSVLVEAGTALNTALLTQDFVDKVVLYQAPTSLGGAALPFASNLSLSELENRLTAVEVESFPNGAASDIRTTGYRHDPWAGVDRLVPDIHQPRS